MLYSGRARTTNSGFAAHDPVKRGFQTCFAWVLVGELAFALYAQQSSTPEPPRPLVLTEAIPMPGIQGRFDHFGFDGRNQLIVAALGNNTVEIIDISARIRSNSITGIPNPQGVVYAPESKKLFAASSKASSISTMALLSV